MFTTVMYGFINEVTRQPGVAAIPLKAARGNTREHSAPRRQRPLRPAAKTRRQARPLPGTYRVLADSFRRAAGFL